VMSTTPAGENSSMQVIEYRRSPSHKTKTEVRHGQGPLHGEREFSCTSKAGQNMRTCPFSHANMWGVGVVDSTITTLHDLRFHILMAVSTPIAKVCGWKRRNPNQPVLKTEREARIVMCNEEGVCFRSGLPSQE
jgi:hypothetical protein